MEMKMQKTSDLLVLLGLALLRWTPEFDGRKQTQKRT